MSVGSPITGAGRVVVVGAGPAGVRAVETLVDHGISPVLVDEADAAGGQIYRQPPSALKRGGSALYGFEAAKAAALHATFDRIKPHIDYRPRTLAWNIQDSAVHLYRDGCMTSVAYDALVLATGATDRLLPLPGWTLPGVYTLGAAQIALKSQSCVIGRSTVFVGSTPLLYLAAYQYVKAGAHVAAVLDTGRWLDKACGVGGMLAGPGALAKGLFYIAALRARGVPLHHGSRSMEIVGSDGVEAVRFCTARGDARTVRCDAVALGFHLRSETQLAELAGCAFEYDTPAGQWKPCTESGGRASYGVYLAGDGAQIAGADAAETAGALAAFTLLSDWQRLSENDPRLMRLRNLQRRQLRFRGGVLRAFPLPRHVLQTMPDEAILCRCEQISVGAFKAAHAVGLDADDLNRRKAFSRVGMGPCQGRYCGLAAAHLLAEQRGAPLREAGRLRAQAPVKPIPLYATVGDDAT